MIIPADSVTTTEVQAWQGLHLLHFQGSTCSQKVRLMLGELNLEWASHPINLIRHENSTPWFLGINPRGVVPVLIDSGTIHVESNDILTYLDSRFAKSGAHYFFANSDPDALEAQALLDLEDSLHNDLRLLTIQFGPLPLKPSKQIQAQKNNGVANDSRDREVTWWQQKAETGIRDADIRQASQNYHQALSRLEECLANGDWIVGDHMSIVDISWFVSVQRLVRIGYPLHRHPHVARHFSKLESRQAFVNDSRHPGSMLGSLVFKLIRLRNQLRGNRLADYLA